MRSPYCILKSLTGVRVSTSLRDCYFNGIHPFAWVSNADRLPAEIIKKNSSKKDWSKKRSGKFVNNTFFIFRNFSAQRFVLA